MSLVLVTGDPAGVGGAVVARLAEAGHDVAFAHRGAAEAAAEIVAKAAAGGARVLTREADAAEAGAFTKELRALVKEAEEAAGPLTALVTCAVDCAAPEPDADADAIGPGTHAWTAGLDGLEAAYHACRTLIFSFVRRRGGRVVAVTSTAGLDGDPERPLESAAAEGVAGFVRSVAKEYAGYGITATTVAADPASTRAQDAAPVADLVAFLVSDAASALTGQVLRAGGEAGAAAGAGTAA